MQSDSVAAGYVEASENLCSSPQIAWVASHKCPNPTTSKTAQCSNAQEQVGARPQMAEKLRTSEAFYCAEEKSPFTERLLPNALRETRLRYQILQVQYIKRELGPKSAASGCSNSLRHLLMLQPHSSGTERNQRGTVQCPAAVSTVLRRRGRERCCIFLGFKNRSWKPHHFVHVWGSEATMTALPCQAAAGSWPAGARAQRTSLVTNCSL